MVYQRFISIFLLVLYGVPSAIGPYWHHHGLSCTHSNAPADGTMACAEVPNVDHACPPCHHDHDGCGFPESSRDKEKNEDHFPRFSINSVHGFCPICAYYSQAQTVAHYEVVVPSCDLIQPAPGLLKEVFDSEKNLWRARGPPSCA